MIPRSGYPAAMTKTALTLSLTAVALLIACKPDKQGAGMVVEGGATPVAIPEGGAPSATTAVDPNQCQGCAMPVAPTWTFEGIYSDAQCTEPLAQAPHPACVAVTALGKTPFTYVDAVGLRKAGETATITLAAEVAPNGARFRKAGNTCVKANEAATPLTPSGCAGKKVCRDANGALTCDPAACRTLNNGCPNYEDSRMYATIDDPGLKAKAGGGGGNLAACCAAIVAEAKRLGPSPEAGMLMSAAATCQALAAQAGPSGTAPELGALRAALAGRQVPPICRALGI